MYCWNALSHIGCVTVVVGSSGSQIKTVSLDEAFICPSIINQNVWIGNQGHSLEDTFSVDQRATDIVVTRTDRTTGWGMDLRIQCCTTGSKLDYNMAHQSLSGTCVDCFNMHFLIQNQSVRLKGTLEMGPHKELVLPGSCVKSMEHAKVDFE